MHRLSDYEKALLEKFNVIGKNTKNIKHNFMPEDQRELDLFKSEEKVAVDLTPPEQAENKTLFSTRDLLKSCINKIINRFENNNEFSGLLTNFNDLDDRTQGLQKGDVIVIASCPSMGKTTFALNVAENVALKSKKNVAIFSLDIPADELMISMISSVGLINSWSLHSGFLSDEDWIKLTRAITMLNDSGIFINENKTLSPLELIFQARKLKQEHNIELIIIDHLQLMQTDLTEKRTHKEKLYEILHSLKLLAKELDIPVIVLYKINKNFEKRKNKRPTLFDLPESGVIEKYADLILFLYRHEVYDPDSEFKDIAEVIIGQQKNGCTGKVLLTFNHGFRHFRSIEKDEWID